MFVHRELHNIKHLILFQSQAQKYLLDINFDTTGINHAFKNIHAGQNALDIWNAFFLNLN